MYKFFYNRKKSLVFLMACSVVIGGASFLLKNSAPDLSLNLSSAYEEDLDTETAPIPGLAKEGSRKTGSYKGYIIEYTGETAIEYQDRTGEANFKTYKGTLSKQQLAQGDASAIPQSKIKTQFTTTLNAILVDVSDDEAIEIRKSPNVKSVYPNYEVKAILDQSVPLIGAPSAWKPSAGGYAGKGIRIGIIDTGVDYTHPDLGGCLGVKCKVIGGYDFVNGDNDPKDDHGHGTHVASIAAGKSTKLSGVAPDASIVAYKVLDKDGLGYLSDVIAAVEKSVDPNGDGNKSDHLDIISMSLGAYDGNPSDPLSKAVDRAVGAGVIAVAVAGNSGPGEKTILSPGTSRQAITVGATDKSDLMANFSSRGPVEWVGGIIYKPDIVAPGVDICAAEWSNWLSTLRCKDNKHISLSGTSMATPHVAGVAALLKQANPNWKPGEIKMALRNTAKKLTGENQQTQGYGRLAVVPSIATKNPPPIASINTSGKVNQPTDINVTATSRVPLKSAVLYVEQKNNSGIWTLLATSSSPMINKAIYKLDPFTLPEGNNTLRLVVTSSDGQISEDKVLVSINNLEITSPMGSDIIKQGNIIVIKGTVGGKFDNYVVEYISSNSSDTAWSSSGITLTNSGKLPVKGTIAKWDTKSVKEGHYILKLSVNGPVPSTDSVRFIYIDPNLRQGWPKRIKEEKIPAGLTYQQMFPNAKNFIFTDPSYSNPTTKGKITAVTSNNLSKVASLNIQTNSGYGIWVGSMVSKTADLNNDGKKEIIVSVGGSPAKLQVYNRNGSVMWIKPFGNSDQAGGNLAVPAIGDLDGDGNKEIVTFDLNDGDFLTSKIYAFDKSGNVVSGFPVTIPKQYMVSIEVADLNLDSKGEIIVHGQSGSPQYVLILNNAGEMISRWTVLESTWMAFGPNSNPSVGNFDSDPELEIVIAQPSDKAGYDFNQNKWINEGMLGVYNTDGTLVPGWPVIIPGIPFSTPSVGDIDHDGSLNIVLGLIYASDIFPDPSAGGLYAFDNKGNVMPGWPFHKGYNFWSSSSLGDFDKNGDLEIGAGELGFNSYILHHDGSVAPGWPQNTTWNDYYGSLIADINGDGNPDLITTAGNGFYPDIGNHGGVHAWNYSGSIISGFPKVTEVDAQAPAIIDDLDGDGKLELIATSDWDMDFIKGLSKMRGSIYVWDLKTPINKKTMFWPTIYQNYGNTSLFNSSLVVTPIPTPIISPSPTQP